MLELIVQLKVSTGNQKFFYNLMHVASKTIRAGGRKSENSRSLNETKD